MAEPRPSRPERASTQDVARRVRSAASADLAIRVDKVALDGSDRDTELGSDLLVAEARREPGQDVDLAWCQPIQPSVWGDGLKTGEVERFAPSKLVDRFREAGVEQAARGPVAELDKPAVDEVGGDVAAQVD